MSPGFFAGVDASSVYINGAGTACTGERRAAPLSACKVRHRCLLVCYYPLAAAPALVALQASARTTTSAHGYRAAPGCVLSLAHPFIAPLTAALLVGPSGAAQTCSLVTRELLS